MSREQALYYYATMFGAHHEELKQRRRMHGTSHTLYFGVCLTSFLMVSITENVTILCSACFLHI